MEDPEINIHSECLDEEEKEHLMVILNTIRKKQQAREKWLKLIEDGKKKHVIRENEVKYKDDLSFLNKLEPETIEKMQYFFKNEGR